MLYSRDWHDCKSTICQLKYIFIFFLIPYMNMLITGVGCHFLLQGIFPTQGSDLGLLPHRQILYSLSHQGSPIPYTYTYIYDIIKNIVPGLIKISQPQFSYNNHQMDIRDSQCLTVHDICMFNPIICTRRSGL